MKFRQYFLINEADPPGLGGPPMGGPPGLGGPPGGPPGLGGPPMGGPPGGPPGLGGPPMGGPPGLGGPPPGAPTSEPPVIPKHADVWDVLDFILNNKPLEHQKKIQAQNQNNQTQQPDVSAPQTQMPAGPALMS